jgi:hypothetical protein
MLLLWRAKIELAKNGHAKFVDESSLSNDNRSFCENDLLIMSSLSLLYN